MYTYMKNAFQNMDVVRDKSEENMNNIRRLNCDKIGDDEMKCVYRRKSAGCSTGFSRVGKAECRVISFLTRPIAGL